MYAIQLSDLLAAQKQQSLVSMLVRPHIGREIIEIDKLSFDHVATPLTCGDDQAEAIVKILRLHFKPHELRIWQGKPWKRI